MLLAISLVTPILNSFALSSTVGTSNSMSAANNLNVLDMFRSIFKNQVPYIDPELKNSEGLNRVILVVREEANIVQIASHMVSCRVTPPIGGVRLVLGTVDASKIESLTLDTATFAILKDREIEFAESPRSRLSQGNFMKNIERTQSDLSGREAAGDNLPHNVTMREVVEIMNATGVWTDYGFTGEDVKIAIIDTGVDYGSLGLGYWDVIARDVFGYPATFDADAACFVYTNMTLTAFTNASGTFIPTAGIDPPLYVFNNVIPFSGLFGTPFPSDMNVTGILNEGQSCHWGVMFQWLFGLDLFPVLVLDSDTDGVYDTVYVDLSFDWCWIPYLYSLIGFSWYWSAPWPPDYSFTDETPLGITSPVGARDFTGDGIFDISVSSLGYFLDVWGVSPNSEDRGLVLKPIDPNGNYVCFVYDFDGHGTSCASCAAGRNLGHPLFGNGMAYNAKIMGVTALFIGDVIEGELWAAGFDLIPGTEGWSYIPGYGYVYGLWSYTGNHKADIISNSWGASAWALWSWMDQSPWYDVLTMLEDALTIPEYLDPYYPGTIIVHAGGNGAAGYGTFTEPSFSTLAISVGASTSMNWTQYEWGFAGGYYDDVISWSARGPTALGTAKPDVLGVGAFGYAPTALFWGAGDGTMAFDVFGGTSMATPVVAGAAALVVQAFNEIGFYNPPNMLVKSVLKSTAVDLGYDPFVQGAGRVDCYRAVSLIMGEEGVLTVSDATWKNALDMIQIPEILNYELSDGLIPPFMPSAIFDTSWFAGTVKPGENTKADFLVSNPTAEDVTVSVSPVTHKQTGSTIVLEGLTASLPSDWQSIGWAWGNITVLSIDMIPEDADLMTVTLVFSYDYFDTERDYLWNNRLRVMVQDWEDANVDGEVNVDEVWQINYGYNYGTSCEATVGFPGFKFKHTPTIFISQVSETYEPIPFKVYIKFYKRTTWDWIGLSQSVFTVNAGDTTFFNATLTVPEGAPQGVYEGQLIIDVNGRKNAVPVSVNVPTVVPSGQLVYEMGTPEYDCPYNPFEVKGYFDWGWRYEAGDWKNWLFEFADQSTIAAFVYADWQGNMTDVDMFAIHPMGMITDGTGENWMSDGIFNWTTRTASTEEYVVLWTGDLPFVPPSIHVPELHTVLLHNVLFDGSVFPENLSCTIKMINVNPASPMQLIIQPGETKSATFTLSTGVRLTDVHLYPDGEFPMEVEPSDVHEIPEMGSQTFNVRIQVPSDAPPGRYLMAVYLMASEIPSNVHIPIFIYVDVPNLEIADVKVDVGRVHFPSEFAQLYIMTTVNGSFVDMADNVTATLWYRTTSGTYLSLDLSTAVNPIQIGLYVVEFEVPIDATSCCLVVQVDKYFELTNVLYKGTAMASFDICSTLSTMNAMLISVNGTTATINTIVGTISANLTNLDAKLTGLITNSKDEIIAKIDTVLGTIQTDLDYLNATLLHVNGTTATINTSLGLIDASLETIGLKVTLIEGNVTAIRTSLGDNIRGIIETIDGNVATIKTDVGTIKVNVGNIEGYTANIPQATWTIWTTTVLSLIAATCSTVTLLLLKKKPKT